MFWDRDVAPFFREESLKFRKEPVTEKMAEAEIARVFIPREEMYTISS